MNTPFKTLWSILLAILMLIAMSHSAVAQQPPDSSPQHSADEQTLLEVADGFSATTSKGGAGWEAYAEFLHDDFTRWTPGRDVWDRAKTIELIRSWWEAGNRMAKSETELISLRVRDHTGVIRRKFSETYVDQENKDAGSFTGFVTQVWIRDGKSWKLLAATIQPAG